MSIYKKAFGFLRRFISPHRFYFIAASVIAGVTVFTGIVQAKATEKLVNNAVDMNMSSVWLCLLVYAAVVCVNVLLSYYNGVFISKLGAFTGGDIKKAVASRLIDANYHAVASAEAGDMLHTVNSDTATVCDFLGGSLCSLISQFFIALGTLVYIIAVNPLLALVTFLYTPLGMWSTLTLNKKMNALYPFKTDGERAALSAVEQALCCIPVIKTFAAEKYMRRRIESNYAGVYYTSAEIAKWNALIQPACSMTSMIPRICYLIFSAYLVSRGSLTVGAMLAVFDMLNLVIAPTVYFPFLLNCFNKSIASIERIDNVLHLPVNDNAPVRRKSERPRVIFTDVCFGYTDGHEVICGQTFTLAEKGIVALCGASGSGKSTLLDLISGLLEPDSGSVSVEGTVGVVSQQTYIFDATVHENVRLARPDASDDEVFAALKAAGADEIKDANDLSGGEKQRISLARVILTDADIWLLDEPTSALDADTEALILDTIRKYASEKLIVIAAHRQSLIDIANGRIDL